MKGTFPYTGKAGSLIFVSFDVTHREAKPTQVDGGKYRKELMCACGMGQLKKPFITY